MLFGSSFIEGVIGSLHLVHETSHTVAASGRNFVNLDSYLSAYSWVKIQREGAPCLKHLAVNTCAVECYPIYIYIYICVCVCIAHTAPYVLTPRYS
jgi:hypothetical protein